MFYAYVLQSKKYRSRYYGVTGDLKRRLKEHNTGKVFSTKGRKPFELVYYEVFSDFKSARKKELYFKSGVGRERLDKKLNHGPVV